MRRLDLRLLEDAVQRARCEIIAGVTGNRYTPRFCRVLILMMATTAMRHFVPPVRFYELDNISYFHAVTLSPVGIIGTRGTVGKEANRLVTLGIHEIKAAHHLCKKLLSRTFRVTNFFLPSLPSTKTNRYAPMNPGPGCQ